jgi:hypothetical protein
MATLPRRSDPISPVVQQILESFLSKISEDSALGGGLSARLRAVLNDLKSADAEALKEALFRVEDGPE